MRALIDRQCKNCLELRIKSVYVLLIKWFESEWIFKYLKVGAEYVMIAYNHMFRYTNNVTTAKVQRTKLLYILKG